MNTLVFPERKQRAKSAASNKAMVQFTTATATFSEHSLNKALSYLCCMYNLILRQHCEADAITVHADEETGIQRLSNVPNIIYLVTGQH